jgi:hypothetical protein
LKYGELAVTVAEFVVVCKGLVEVQVATVVKWAKYYQDLVLYYVQARQDVVDLLIQAVQDVEVMHVRQLVVAMEHIFVYVHQVADTVVQTVTLDRVLEHIVDAQLTHVDVYKGQIFQFADSMAVAQGLHFVQVRQ